MISESKKLHLYLAGSIVIEWLRLRLTHVTLNLFKRVLAQK